MSPNARSEERLAIGLALIAGYVDAIGLIHLGAYVSFMSGNTTQTGAMSGLGKFSAALPSSVAIVFFVAGCFAGTWLKHSRRKHPRRFLYGVIAILLAIVLGGSRFAHLNSNVDIAILSLAMGLLNTTLSQVGDESVNLTFVTGTLSKIGGHLALAVRGMPLKDASSSEDTHLRRAGILMCIWTGFLAGAILSGAVSSYLETDALVVPLLVLVTLGIFKGD